MREPPEWRRTGRVSRVIVDMFSVEVLEEIPWVFQGGP